LLSTPARSSSSTTRMAADDQRLRGTNIFMLFVMNIPDLPSRRSQAMLTDTDAVPNVNMIDDVVVTTSVDVNCHPSVSSCVPKTVGSQQSSDLLLVNPGNKNGTSRNPCRVESDMSDHRTVVSRVQRVSCVCEPDASGDSFECDTPHTLCSDSMNWLAKDDVLCMSRRAEDNNMAVLKRYLMYRFPQIPEQFRDVIIVSTFTAAQKVALTYFDTLHEGATERNIWAKNYLHKWSHGMSACEPVLKYIPSTKTTLAPENTQVYSPMNNYLMTREFPVSYESQKREFDRVTEQIVANVPVACNSNETDVNKHLVIDTLVSVAQNLLALSSTSNITVPKGDVEQQNKPDLPMEDVAVVPNDATVTECSNVSNAIPSMPNLDEFMLVVVNGQVQPVDRKFV